MPSLEKFDYANVPLVLYSIHKENVLQLENVHSCNLVKLEISRYRKLPYYNDILKICLSVCSKLEIIDCFIFEEEQLSLFNHSHLKELRITFCTTDPKINIGNFLKMNGSHLTYLDISDCVISVSALPVYCPALKYFYADCVDLTHKDDDGDLKRNFSSLTHCRFSSINPSSAKTIHFLFSSTPNLKSILFESCILSIEMETQILMWCENPSAESIEFEYSHLEIEFLKDILLSCPSLKAMYLQDCTVNIRDAENILRNIAKSLPNQPTIKFY